MKRVLPALIALFVLLTGCSGNTSQPSGGISPDQVFSGGSVSIDGYDRPSNMIDISSQQLVTNIRIGWNVGNALDSCTADLDGDRAADRPGQTEDETSWGNPMLTEQYFKTLADNGINAVRLPITWRGHIDADGNIEETWLNRVKQVVDYAYDNGMYVIITMYHDGAADADFGAWIRNARYDRDEVLARYSRIWSQIAEKFITYNERLLYESMNRVEFPELDSDKAYELFNAVNQEFVNTVRRTGGNNLYRHLVIAGYGADILETCDGRFKMPEDMRGKCILSVQYYIPRTFCVDGVIDHWGSAVEENWMDSRVELLRTRFVDNGIPVIISEYGAPSLSDETSRIYFCERLTKQCRDNYISTFLWDDGSVLDRKEYVWREPKLLAALRRATSGNAYVPKKQSETQEAVSDEEYITEVAVSMEPEPTAD